MIIVSLEQSIIYNFVIYYIMDRAIKIIGNCLPIMTYVRVRNQDYIPITYTT